MQNFYEPNKNLFYISGIWIGPNDGQSSPPALGGGIIASVVSAGIKVIQRGSRHKTIGTPKRTFLGMNHKCGQT